MIHFLNHNEIDKTKWDLCIGNDPNGLVYGLSWYLDIVSPGWEALVEGDYETIMPLTRKKKIGINYIIQPPFCQQLGIFGPNSRHDETCKMFLNSIPSTFKYININLNSINVPAAGEHYCKQRINQLLSLNSNYPDLYKNFDNKTKKNIKRSVKRGIMVDSDISLIDFFRLKVDENSDYMSPMYNKFLEKLMIAIPGQVEYKVFVARDQNTNEVVGGIMAILFKSRLTFLSSFNSMEGKEKLVMYPLFDKCINILSGTNLTLDFAGSNMKGVHYFNKGFGAHDTIYTQLIINRLIWPFNYYKE
jgi:hypothetical protein